MRRLPLIGLLIVLAVLPVIMLPRMARATDRSEASLELDSLVYASDAIVEGRLVEAGVDRTIDPAKVRVSAVYLGPVKPAQTIIVMGMRDYGLRWPSGHAALGPGDSLCFFLRGVGGAYPIYPASAGVAFMPTPDGPQPDYGLRLLIRGKAYQFLQASKPNMRFGISWGQESGPYFVGTSCSNRWATSIAEFRRELRASVRRSADWHAHFNTAPSLKDAPWLLSLLRERYLPSAGTAGWYYQSGADCVANAAADRVLAIGDLDLIDRTIEANPNEADHLARAFVKPEGFKYVLGRLLDRALPAEHRKQLADEIDLGLYWLWRGFPAAPGAGDSADFRTGPYCSAIARVAAELSARGDDEITVILLTALEHDAEWRGVSDRTPLDIKRDLNEAADILCRLYAKHAASGDVQYKIEQLMVALGENRYESLHSRCGRLLTVAQAPSFDHYYPDPGNIVLQYKFHDLGGAVGITGTQLVLEPVKSGKTYVLPSAMTAGQYGVLNPYDSGNDCIPLPPGFQPGRYRLHYRFVDHQRIVCEGHGFETMLPQRYATIPPVSRLALVMYAIHQPWPDSVWETIWSIVIGIPLLLLLRAIVRSRREYGRMRRGLCPQCAYDLRATGERCPECGTPTAANFHAGLVARCAMKIALAGLAFVFIATTVLWVRSYWAADCVVRTTMERADSIYASRGVFVLAVNTIDGEQGLTYEHGRPADFPRSLAESGDVVTCGLAGMEYSWISGITIVPAWAPAGLAAILGGLLIRKLQKLNVLAASANAIAS
ncbi:MAG TPA: hypothetical protein VFC78_12645 [Tepidisphaeraceae bacterium]|nr:hypothetical protein [Tepidisphaeraceae bacterium]